MSTVKDRGVIDITLQEDSHFVLIILDDLEWKFSTRQNHGRILQDKINDYLGYIASGQAEEACPGKRPMIRILAEYSYSRYCLDFLERVRNYIRSHGDFCDIEWTHDEAYGPYEDGFSDDFVFDVDKIYPRLKKNWAKDPLKEISLMAANPEAPDYSDQMIMVRVMDSFIGMFVQDVGEVFTYITYDMIPENITPEQLQQIAFDNLIRDVKYQIAESKEPGIFGILAGGDFEAESLCLNDIWKSGAELLGEDLVIAVPTKDIVFFTKANDRKLRRKLLKMAEEMYRTNQKETPYLLFCRDIFIYSKAEEQLWIEGQW